MLLIHLDKIKINLIWLFTQNIWNEKYISKYFSNPCGKPNDIYLAATLGLNVDRAKRGLVISITQKAFHRKIIYCKNKNLKRVKKMENEEKWKMYDKVKNSFFVERLKWPLCVCGFLFIWSWIELHSKLIGNKLLETAKITQISSLAKKKRAASFKT